MKDADKHLLETIRTSLMAMGVILLLQVLLLTPLIMPPEFFRLVSEQLSSKTPEVSNSWTAPDSLTIPATPEGDLIRYGRELVAHTATYLGPQGSVMTLTNGMNCQNCHLKAGKKSFGNNYSAVASTYPKLRARSGTIESVEKRVNDCMVRSLNGKELAEQSREMQALVSYVLWVGKDVPKDSVPHGSGIAGLPVLSRPADPAKGMKIYQVQCARCHGSQGQGIKKTNINEWHYPPLWGPESFNSGAGLYRISRLAGYVKMNMPQDLTINGPILSDADAWDVAAYVNSMPRPGMDLSSDWPDIKAKPFDHPFGPFADGFTEEQHKYGPFPPILDAKVKK